MEAAGFVKWRRWIELTTPEDARMLALRLAVDLHDRGTFPLHILCRRVKGVYDLLPRGLWDTQLAELGWDGVSFPEFVDGGGLYTIFRWARYIAHGGHVFIESGSGLLSDNDALGIRQAPASYCAQYLAWGYLVALVRGMIGPNDVDIIKILSHIKGPKAFRPLQELRWDGVDLPGDITLIERGNLICWLWWISGGACGGWPHFWCEEEAPERNNKRARE